MKSGRKQSRVVEHSYAAIMIDLVHQIIALDP